MIPMSFDFMAVLLLVVVVRCLDAIMPVQEEWHGSNTGGSVLATDLQIAYRFAYAPARPQSTVSGVNFKSFPCLHPSGVPEKDRFPSLQSGDAVVFGISRRADDSHDTCNLQPADELGIAGVSILYDVKQGKK